MDNGSKGIFYNNLFVQWLLMKLEMPKKKMYFSEYRIATHNSRADKQIFLIANIQPIWRCYET